MRMKSSTFFMPLFCFYYESFSWQLFQTSQTASVFLNCTVSNTSLYQHLKRWGNTVISQQEGLPMSLRTTCVRFLQRLRFPPTVHQHVCQVSLGVLIDFWSKYMHAWFSAQFLLLVRQCDFGPWLSHNQQQFFFLTCVTAHVYHLKQKYCQPVLEQFVSLIDIQMDQCWRRSANRSSRGTSQESYCLFKV